MDQITLASLDEVIRQDFFSLLRNEMFLTHLDSKSGLLTRRFSDLCVLVDVLLSVTWTNELWAELYLGCIARCLLGLPVRVYDGHACKTDNYAGYNDGEFNRNYFLDVCGMACACGAFLPDFICPILDTVSLDDLFNNGAIIDEARKKYPSKNFPYKVGPCLCPLLVNQRFPWIRSLIKIATQCDPLPISYYAYAKEVPMFLDKDDSQSNFYGDTSAVSSENANVLSTIFVLDPPGTDRISNGYLCRVLGTVFFGIGNHGYGCCCFKCAVAYGREILDIRFVAMEAFSYFRNGCPLKDALMGFLTPMEFRICRIMYGSDERKKIEIMVGLDPYYDHSPLPLIVRPQSTLEYYLEYALRNCIDVSSLRFLLYSMHLCYDSYDNCAYLVPAGPGRMVLRDETNAESYVAMGDPFAPIVLSSDMILKPSDVVGGAMVQEMRRRVNNTAYYCRGSSGNWYYLPSEQRKKFPRDLRFRPRFTIPGKEKPIPTIVKFTSDVPVENVELLVDECAGVTVEDLCSVLSENILAPIVSGKIYPGFIVDYSTFMVYCGNTMIAKCFKFNRLLKRLSPGCIKFITWLEDEIFKNHCPGLKQICNFTSRSCTYDEVCLSLDNVKKYLLKAYVYYCTGYYYSDEQYGQTESLYPQHFGILESESGYPVVDVTIEQSYRSHFLESYLAKK